MLCQSRNRRSLGGPYRRQGGCLSVPETSGTVLRADRIVLRYLDETTLRPVTDTVEGFTAVIFQHEIDHLDGVLFIDRMQRGN